MDLGAIILDPFDVRHLTVLQEAVRDTCREYKVPPERTRVAYSAHAVLGQRIVVHIHPGGDDDVHDPFLFLSDHDGFGASLSGCLGDKLGEPVPTSTAWSVSRERRTDLCSVAKGFYYTAEDVDSAEDSGPFQRLASKLGVAPDVLLRLLEMPVTEWMPVTSDPTSGAVAELQSRLALAPLSDQPPRAEPSATFAFYLPEQMCREAQELAKKLKATLGELLIAGWEIAKAEVYAATPVFDENFNEAPPMRAPDAHPVSSIEIPSSAAPLREPPGSKDKVKVEIAAPPRMVEEIQVLARAADRAQSWVMERAYIAARARLHQAQRR
ncbi:MAG: hypothetical protein IT384_29120 [Deltaproteobacteria bacterium]|nr:hypothetical protein [Deltaproteobacteria bacterium]